MCGTAPTMEQERSQVLGLARERPCTVTRMQSISLQTRYGRDGNTHRQMGDVVAKNLWSGLSESNRHLNLGNSEANGKNQEPKRHFKEHWVALGAGRNA
jgi:hypothetical protein